MPDEEKDASESSSVRDDLLAAIKEHEDAGENTPEPIAAERARDESGRFASKEPKNDPEPTRVSNPGVDEPGRVAAESAPNTHQGAPAPAAQQAASDPQLAAAPHSWSNSVKSKWATLDPEVRAEILKREADVHRGFTKNDEERNFGKEMRQVIAPYEAIIRASGGTVPAAISDVLNTAYILRTADPVTKARTIAQVCQQYGIDLNLAAQPGQQQLPPEVAGLYQEVNQLKATLQARQQHEEQLTHHQVLTAIETFSQDPKHPHFKVVQAHMGALMQAGQAQDMEEAYQMAVWARPDLRAQLLADQQAQQKAEVEKRQRTEKARTKAVSVRGGPGGYTAPAKEPGTVREALEAAMAEHAQRL